MTPEAERKVLQSLYDRLHDAITYSPDGKSAAFDPASSFVQMARNLVVSPDDFANMMSPSTPNGDLAKAEAFAALVDAIPNPEPVWSDSGSRVSETYRTVVDGANTSAKVGEEQQKIYDLAYDYLNEETTTTDFKGNEKTTSGPSAIATTYDSNQAAYVSAVGGFRTAYNGYDLTQISDQRGWQAVAPGLQLTVDQAWNKWNQEGRAEVEEARDAMAASVNNAVSATIQQAQTLVNGQHQLASSSPGGGAWLPSYALPSDWYAATSKATKLTLTSKYLNETASTQATSYGASISAGYGLWRASGGVSGSHEESSRHMDAENFELEAELIFVQIKRPWFNPLIFRMDGWSNMAFGKHQVSNGSLRGARDRTMPLVPTGFVLARDATISADFSSEDESFVSKSIAASATVGWGPFGVGGKFAHSSSDSEFEAKFDGGRLELPGLQLVAWVSTIIPPSPPEDPA